MLCITLKPDFKLSGNFVWLDMGFPNTEKDSNTLNAPVFTNSNLCCLAIYIHLYSILLNFQVKKIIWNVSNSCWWRTNMQKAFCPFCASLLYENVLKKRVSSWDLWIEIYLVAVFDTECVTCLHLCNETGKFVFATDCKYAVCFDEKRMENVFWRFCGFIIINS